MLAYTMRRILSALPVILIAVTVSFFIMRLAPGGPFDGGRSLPPAVLANVRAHYHLDQPILTQYLDYLFSLVRGDLGPSMAFHDYNVTQLMVIGLPFTLTLGFTAFFLATAVGLVAGIIAALYQNKWPDIVLVLAVML